MTTDGPEIVSVAQGRLCGRRDGDVAAFLGVPYGEQDRARTREFLAALRPRD